MPFFWQAREVPKGGCCGCERRRRKEVPQDEGRFLFKAVVHGSKQHGIFKEISVGYGFGYTGELLINHAARAYVGVTDLAVAHLSVGKTDIHARSADLRVRIHLDELIEIGGFGRINGIVFVVRIDSKPSIITKTTGFFMICTSLIWKRLRQ